MNANDNATEAEDNLDAVSAPSGLPVAYVADLLVMTGAKPVTVVASPNGAEGSTATVMLARAIAELARSVVVVDMTASGAPSRLMASDEKLPGIMDLLTGDAAFGETIHRDRLSTAHIVPRGIGSGQRVSGILERLVMILGALSGSYDTVLLEFGAADPGEISRILKYVEADVVVSVPDGDPTLLRDAASAFQKSGHSQIIAMISSPRDRQSPKTLV